MRQLCQQDDTKTVPFVDRTESGYGQNGQTYQSAILEFTMLAEKRTVVTDTDQ